MNAHDVPDLAYGDPPDAFDSAGTCSEPAAAIPGQAADDGARQITFAEGAARGDFVQLERKAPEQPDEIPEAFARHVRSQFPSGYVLPKNEITGRWRHLTGPAEREFWREVEALAAQGARPAPGPDGQQRYIDQLHDLIRDMCGAYPGLATELPAFQDRAGQLYVHDHDGQPISGSWADSDGPRAAPAEPAIGGAS